MLEEIPVARAAASLAVVRNRLRQVAVHLCLSEGAWAKDWSGQPLIYQLVSGPWYASAELLEWKE